TSRSHPCVSLSLHLHQVVKRTFTSKLSNMLGTQKLAQRVNAGKRLEINDKPQRGGTDFGCLCTKAIDRKGSSKA
ncbi:MAG TPA: hypothetical protein VG649_23615, partial [Candidatus Angelobacter sp.]|nr:hypothetical protein [Candidatus Angelobacter sp.]